MTIAEEIEIEIARVERIIEEHESRHAWVDVVMRELVKRSRLAVCDDDAGACWACLTSLRAIRP